MNNLQKVLLLLFLLIGIGRANAQQPINEIRFGTAKIDGTVTSSTIPLKEITLRVAINDLLSSSMTPSILSAQVQPDGHFKFNIPLSTRMKIVTIVGFDQNGLIMNGHAIGLDQQNPLHVQITLEKDNSTLTANGGMNFTTEDMKNFPIVLSNFIEGEGNNSADSANYNMPLEQYIRKETQTLLPQRIKRAVSDLKLSDKAMPYLLQTCNLYYIKGRIFWYKENAAKRFHINVQEPPLSFYSFLKNYDLQSSNILAEPYIYDFCKRCLEMPVFNIPSIATTPTDKWIASVGKNMATVTGFSTGTFYEVLAMVAYASQIKDNIEPLSTIQQQFIESYFTGTKKDIATALLKMNDKLVQELKAHSHIQILPTGEKEQLLKNILSKYPGKAVMIDFWNTWCAPCMMAHKEMRKVKPMFESSNIAFIYLADTSSPETEWHNNIKVISGEHYYLPHKKLSDLLGVYNATSIPFYLIFNKEHKLLHKSEGFPGTQTIQKWLMEACE